MDLVGTTGGGHREQKSIPESSRIGSRAAAAYAAPPIGEYEFQPASSFRCDLAIAVGKNRIIDKEGNK